MNKRRIPTLPYKPHITALIELTKNNKKQTYTGNFKLVLKQLLFEKIQLSSMVTNPPFGSAKCIEVWKLTYRLMKPGGWLLSISDTYRYHHMACAIEDAGFEIRDMIQWMSSARKSICMARKPIDGTNVQNVLKHGTGFINIDASRIGTLDDIKNHGRSAKAAVSKGIYGNSKSTKTHKTEGQKLGRWPANVVHDGGDEVMEEFAKYGYFKDAVAIRRNSNGKYIFSNNKKPTRVDDMGYGGSGTVARFFYSAKASKVDKFGSAHPTVKPTSLMKYLIRLVTPPNGLTMDMFAGSGSSVSAALDIDGCRIIAIEKDLDYVKDILKRVDFHYGKSTSRMEKLW